MIIDLQITLDNHNYLPTSKDFKKWCCLVFNELKKDSNVEITIRLTNDKEIQQLNYDYRGKNNPTNILSFTNEIIDINPMELQMAYAGDVSQIDTPFIGDLVISVETMKKEAKEQNKDLINHYAHITIHGVLHLLGYDHIENQQANIMENIEIRTLKKLKIKNPYD